MKMSKQKSCDSIVKDKILQVSSVLSSKFKTCLLDSLLDAIWRPKMKNMRTGIKLRVMAFQNAYRTDSYVRNCDIYYALSKLTKRSDMLF